MRAMVGLLLVSVCFAEVVRLETADGVEVVGELHLVDKEAPTVVCLPMYRHARKTYDPLLGPLKAKGINAFVLDLRGHGDSAPQLAEAVAKRDAGVFNAMHEDVAAAIRHLAAKGCDTTRIGLVGASVGCSVAIDATVRDRHGIRAVVLLTPGANYLGLNTLDHLKHWPGTRVLTLCSTEERRTSQPVVDALAKFPGSSHDFVEGEGIHGTRMFGRVEGVEERIAAFLAASMADLRVPRWPAGDRAAEKPGFFAKILRPTREADGTTFGLMAWAMGDAWSFGGIVDQPFDGTLRVTLDGKVHEFVFDTAKTGTIRDRDGAVTGEQASFRGKSWMVFRLPAARSGAALALEFRRKEGGTVRLPGGTGGYSLHLHGVK